LWAFLQESQLTPTLPSAAFTIVLVNAPFALFGAVIFHEAVHPIFAS
jgi:hypothetical protein